MPNFDNPLMHERSSQIGFLFFILTCLLAVVAVAQLPPSAPTTKPDSTVRKADADRKVKELWDSLAQSLKDDPKFDQKATRDILRKLPPALSEARYADPDPLVGRVQYGQRLIDLYKLIGVDPQIPFPTHSDADFEEMAKIAARSTMSNGQQVMPGTPQFEEIKTNLPEIVPMQLAMSLKILSLDDQEFAASQKRLNAFPEFAKEDLSTRMGLLNSRLKLWREGRFPK